MSGSAWSGGADADDGAPRSAAPLAPPAPGSLFGGVGTRIRLRNGRRRWESARVVNVRTDSGVRWTIESETSSYRGWIWSPGTHVDVRVDLAGGLCGAFQTVVTKLTMGEQLQYDVPVPEHVRLLARRRSVRQRIERACAVFQSGRESRGLTIDLSDGGLRAALRPVPSVGTARLVLESLEVGARVVEVDEEGEVRIVLDPLTEAQRLELQRMARPALVPPPPPQLRKNWFKRP